MDIARHLKNSNKLKVNTSESYVVVESPVLTRGMASVGGVVVAVSLLAVSMAAVFGANQVCLLECRAGIKDSLYSKPHLEF